MGALSTLLLIAGVYWIAVVSPGPNFLLVSQLALSGRGRLGLFAGAGIAAGSTIWAALAMAGVAALLEHVAWIHTAIRLAGAAYLIWFGIRLLLSARAAGDTPKRLISVPTTGLGAFRSGLLTNLTNPKAGAFWTSVFSSIFPAHAPAWLFVATGIMVPCISGGWYVMLSLLFGSDQVQRRYLALRRPIDAACGAILLGLGATLAASR
ncbi:LysE family translocator [Sphingomonas sp. MMS24-J13]|uniref:LysE family translocator n=1 Tax=Sphingomonas sp. MMS24-J13 TaxID=3238686 RepID=UPI00384E31F9